MCLLCIEHCALRIDRIFLMSKVSKAVFTLAQFRISFCLVSFSTRISRMIYLTNSVQWNLTIHNMRIFSRYVNRYLCVRSHHTHTLWRQKNILVRHDTTIRTVRDWTFYFNICFSKLIIISLYKPVYIIREMWVGSFI